MPVNQGRWIELKRTIVWAELASRHSMGDQFSKGTDHTTTLHKEK
jgi:hypothetical protein